MPGIRVLGRRLRQSFGISAPKVAIRPKLSWRWKLTAIIAATALIVGMWWWGFDFGQFLGGFDHRAAVEERARLESELKASREENIRLRSRASELESDLNMTRGAQMMLSRQTLDLQGENSRLKEELAFLQKFFGDTGPRGAISIERLAAERESDDIWRYSLLVVRGGNPGEEFSGELNLKANIATNGRIVTVTLPDDQPESAPALKLSFKYYQRVEGTLRVPPGSQLRSLEARVNAPSQTTAGATRSLTLP